jgi:hypothetical protein
MVGSISSRPPKTPIKRCKRELPETKARAETIGPLELLDKLEPGTKPLSRQRNAVHWLQRSNDLSETAIEEKRKRDELKAKRELLFERYLKHPMDTRLALEIKIMDDQLAETASQTKRKTGSRN